MELIEPTYTRSRLEEAGNSPSHHPKYSTILQKSICTTTEMTPKDTHHGRKKQTAVRISYHQSGAVDFQKNTKSGFLIKERNQIYAFFSIISNKNDNLFNFFWHTKLYPILGHPVFTFQRGAAERCQDSAAFV